MDRNNDGTTNVKKAAEKPQSYNPQNSNSIVVTFFGKVPHNIIFNVFHFGHDLLYLVMIPTEISISPPGSAITWGCHHQGSRLARLALSWWEPEVAACCRGTRTAKTNSSPLEILAMAISKWVQVPCSTYSKHTNKQRFFKQSLGQPLEMRSKKLLQCLQLHYSRTMASSCRLTSRASQELPPPRHRVLMFNFLWWFFLAHIHVWLFFEQVWSSCTILACIAFMSRQKILFWCPRCSCWIGGTPVADSSCCFNLGASLMVISHVPSAMTSHIARYQLSLIT